MSIQDIAERTRQIERERCRLLILQALAEDSNYTICHAVLVSLLGEYDHAASGVRKDLAWLEEKALLTTTYNAGNMPESTITQAGEDVAHGRTSIAGVHRSRPGQ